MYLGDFNTAVTLDHKFTTVASTGAPTQLAGTPAISVYKDNSTTQSTSGITLSVDFDGVTGLNNVRVDTSADGTFYSAGSTFQIVITTGTVGGTSVVGYVVGTFSLEHRNIQANTTQFAGSAITAASGIPEVKVASLAANAITAASINADAITAAKVAADVTTEIQSGLATAANLATVDTVVDAIKAVTDLLPDAGALTSLATQASVNTIDDFLDTEIAAILALIDTEIATLDTVADAILALLDDARGEPGQGAPPASADMVTKLDYLYKWARNKKDASATEAKYYADDASTVDHKQALSESGGTVTVGEMATGA